MASGESDEAMVPATDKVGLSESVQCSSALKWPQQCRQCIQLNYRPVLGCDATVKTKDKYYMHDALSTARID